MKLDTFCKYFSSDEKVVSGVFQDWKIRFTQPWQLNDPLEGSPSISFERPGTDTLFRIDGITYPSEEIFYRSQLLEAAVNSFGMLSLTRIPDSFEMWALYADGHRGFLVEFAEGFNRQPCMLGRNGRPYAIRAVEYVEDYTINPDELFHGSEFAHDEFVRLVFFRKIKRWRHEEESRIVRNLDDHPDFPGYSGFQTSSRDTNLYLFDLDPECVSSVVFGVHMSSESKKLIYEQLVGTKIKMIQACLLLAEKDENGHQGRIVLEPIEAFGDPGVVLDAKPQMFSAALDGDRNEKRTTHTFSRLSELPYYHRYPHILEEYRERMLRSR